jgi:CheY-like chemotaxis protein
LARETPPDLVFLDIGLPGLSGLEVARRLREEAGERQPLFVAVTGFDQDEDRRRSKEAGIHLHVAKPADPEKLMAVVNRFSRVLAPSLNPEHGDAQVGG